ncbi:MAG: hypothetical protein ACTIAR_09570 [Brachybacterium tyrofermentans]
MLPANVGFRPTFAVAALILALTALTVLLALLSPLRGARSR